MNEIQQTEVMFFVHHYPTHSVVWKVYETTYANWCDLRGSDTQFMFEGQTDGKIYLQLGWPRMMSRAQADNYVSAEPDNAWIRYTVIEIN